MEPKAATVYLARAVEAGRLQRAERGLYTPVISVTSVTSEGASKCLSGLDSKTSP